MHHESQSVDPAVLRELRLGEQLLWWGRPDHQHRARSNYTVGMIFYGIFTGSLAFIFCLGLSPYGAPARTLSFVLFAFLMAILAITLLLLLCIAYALYRIYRKIVIDLRHTTYAITNQRIIYIISYKRNLAVTSHTAEDVGIIQLVETGEGWGDISYGHTHPLHVGWTVTTMIDKLAGIPDARSVEGILLQTFKRREPVTSQV